MGNLSATGVAASGHKPVPASEFIFAYSHRAAKWSAINGCTVWMNPCNVRPVQPTLGGNPTQTTSIYLGD